MIEIAAINSGFLVRRALIGARGDDPVLPERRPRRRQVAATAGRSRRWWRRAPAATAAQSAPPARLKPRGTS
jgi:hypothetical protein